ncbi:MAG: TIGR03557 family F420-dependent LLM class oxidoreductase [Thermoproteota archaeon]
MQLKLGYKTCHEQYQPNILLDYAVLADRYGFDTIWTSDHFHPWAHTNAASGFAWVWIAAAAERTKRAKIGTSVTAPILRYHPAIVAQAFATLAHMYPGRIFLGLGAGEALNESPLGYDWPKPKQRLEMLEEAIIVIKKLWRGSFVNFDGKYYRLRGANLYTKPGEPLRVYIAAGGPKVARLAGKYADGIVFVPKEPRQTELLLSAFDDGARNAGRDPSKLEKVAEILVSYDEDYDAASKSCRFWAGSMLPLFYKYDISDPREIEEHGKFVGDEAIARRWIVANTIDEHVKRLEEHIKAGFNHLYFVSSSPNETKFLKFYGEKVLPCLRELETHDL